MWEVKEANRVKFLLVLGDGAKSGMNIVYVTIGEVVPFAGEQLADRQEAFLEGGICGEHIKGDWETRFLSQVPHPELATSELPLIIRCVLNAIFTQVLVLSGPQPPLSYCSLHRNLHILYTQLCMDGTPQKFEKLLQKNGDMFRIK